MAIYRGNGGAGDSTNDATVSEVTQQAVNAATSATEAAASATTASTKASEASASATTASTKASEASASATSAASSATIAETYKNDTSGLKADTLVAKNAAETAETNAETAQTAAETAQAAAETAKTDAEAAKTSAQNHKVSAQGFATTASTKASEAATSATNAATSATEAETAKTAAETAKTGAETAKTGAETAKTAAETAKTGAETAQTAAETAETNAETAQTAAETAQTAAETAKTGAETAKTGAETAKTGAEAAKTSAENAKTDAQKLSVEAEDTQYTLSDGTTTGYSALHYKAKAEDHAIAAQNHKVSAQGYATTAASEASDAADSATAASNSATAAQNHKIGAQASATTAATKATEASTSATEAATSETNAATSATAAQNHKVSAQGYASTAASEASDAATSATNAATSATNAATSATNAATSATNAANSATSAASAQTAAETAKDAALAALDSFDDRYLGSKTSNPTVDNDGNALVSGALYFNTTDDVMKVYDGSQWRAAYADISGAVLQANNLSDLDNISSARSNLGLGTAATTASTDYATSAQGTKADSALQDLVDDTTPQLGGDLASNGNNINFADNDKAQFGAGNDLQIYHNGSHSYIQDNGTGDLRITTDGTVRIRKHDNEEIATFAANGAASLRYDNAVKFATTSTGVDVTGTTETDNLTVTGTATISGAGAENALTISGTSPTVAFTDTDHDDFYIHVNSNNFYILADRDQGGGYGNWDGPHPLQLEADTNTGYLFGDKIFDESYHPNADKWTTARTLTLTGDATGSVSWDGSANASMTVNVGDADTVDGYHASRFMRRIAKATATVGPGWMTVAKNISGRKHGEVIVTDADSGDHAFIRIEWMRSYGDSNFTVLNCGGNNNRITGARVLYETADNTYGEKRLQVYVTTSSNYEVNVYEHGDIDDYSAHSVVTPVIENSKTGFALHGASLENLDDYGFAAEEGILSGSTIEAANFAVEDKLYHVGAADTYMQFHNSNEWRVVTGGTEMLEVNDTDIKVSAVLDMQNNSIDDVNHIYVNQDVVVGDKIQHLDDGDTYTQFHNNDQWRVVTAGTERLEVNNNEVIISHELDVPIINVSNEIRVPQNSSLTDPSITSTADGNTGINFPANEQIHFITNGTEMMEINDSYNQFSQSSRHLDNVSAYFGNSNDYRIYHDGTNTVFRNYLHAGGDVYHQGEDTSGNNHNTIIERYNNAGPYVEFHGDGAEKLRVNGNGTVLYDELNANNNVITNVEDIYLNDAIYHDSDTDTYMQFPAANEWRVVTGGTERLRADVEGVVINENSVDMDFRVESNNYPSMIKVDGGNDRVGIGQGIPEMRLDVAGGGRIADRYMRRYGTTVAASTKVAVPWKDDGTTTLHTSYTYEFELTTYGTGTDTGAKYLAYYVGGWKLHCVGSSGGGSNHPLGIIESSQFKMYHNHSSSYGINCHVTAKWRNDSDNVLSVFGADGVIKNNGGQTQIGYGLYDFTNALTITSNQIEADTTIRLGDSTTDWSGPGFVVDDSATGFTSLRHKKGTSAHLIISNYGTNMTIRDTEKTNYPGFNFVNSAVIPAGGSMFNSSSNGVLDLGQSSYAWKGVYTRDLYTAYAGSTTVAASAPHCRAWVNFNGTGTVAIRADEGITSITDHGTGMYTLNFVNTMPDNKYCIQGTCSSQDNNHCNYIVGQSLTDANNTTNCRIRIVNGGTASERDIERVYVSIYR